MGQPARKTHCDRIEKNLVNLVEGKRFFLDDWQTSMLDACQESDWIRPDQHGSIHFFSLPFFFFNSSSLFSSSLKSMDLYKEIRRLECNYLGPIDLVASWFIRWHDPAAFLGLVTYSIWLLNNVCLDLILLRSINRWGFGSVSWQSIPSSELNTCFHINLYWLWFIDKRFATKQT